MNLEAPKLMVRVSSQIAGQKSWRKDKPALEDRQESRPSGRSGALNDLLARLDRPRICDDLFDAVPDTIFFVKDSLGRYAAANQTLAERTGFKRKEALIGLAADQVFPGALGRRIAEQDRAILTSARALKGELELHLYPDGREGWCLTWKEPLFDRERAVIGLVGLSRDVRSANTSVDETAALSAALRYAHDHPDVALTIGDRSEEHTSELQSPKD